MYSIIQKCISIFLYIISIFLCTFCLWNGLDQTVLQAPPFQHTKPMETPQAQSYTAKQLGVTSKPQKSPTGLYAKGACLLDASSGRVLFEKSADTQMPMASTTKIMTCILTLESAKLDDTVTFSSHAASMPDVQLNAVAGESFLLKDLLYSLMLESHNDTAVAIAEHVGGSVEGFAAMMNKKAEELGLTNTHFVTPNGLDAKEHYTTPKELCLIAAYAMQNDIFRKIITTKEHSFSSSNKHRSFHVTNHDAFLTSYDGAIGIKTGFTGNAGYCFCGAAKRGDTLLISSVLAAGWPPNKSYKWRDTRKLMDYGFANFTNIEIPSGSRLPSITVKGGRNTTLPLKRSKPLKELTLPLSADDTVAIRYELPTVVTAPIRNGDVVGYENYYLGDMLIQSIPIASNRDIKEVDPLYMGRLLSRLFFLKAIS